MSSHLFTQLLEAVFEYKFAQTACEDVKLLSRGLKSYWMTRLKLLLATHGVCV